MGIDIAFLIILAMAAVKGFSRGLIMAVFSFAALFIGLAAALKLSSVVANYFKESDALPSHWWPVIAFAAVFLVAVLIVKAAGGVVEKTVQLALLGWVNRIGGFLGLCSFIYFAFQCGPFLFNAIEHYYGSRERKIGNL